jgi:cytochrome P450
MRDSVQSQLETAKRKDESYFLGEFYIETSTHNATSQVSARRTNFTDDFAESLVISSDAASKQEGTRSLTEAEVLGNMFFYVLAGFDTTSTTLSFMFLLLALHPSTQVLLQQQLDRVLGSKTPSEWNTDEDVPQLMRGYLGAVMSETLRLYHPVAWYARKAVRETTVTDSKGTSHIIPADTVIMIDVAAIGRHTGYWASAGTPAESKEHSPALDFDPSRWLKTEGQGEQKNEAAFPFSAGHRMCPGKRFAEVEMCAMVARFFSQFSLRLEPDESDALEAKSAGHDQAWLERKTKDRAATALFEGLGFGHGIYPKSHVPFKILVRDDRVSRS